MLNELGNDLQSLSPRRAIPAISMPSVKRGLGQNEYSSHIRAEKLLNAPLQRYLTD